MLLFHTVTNDSITGRMWLASFEDNLRPQPFTALGQGTRRRYREVAHRPVNP
jgi:hypothetical protein